VGGGNALLQQNLPEAVIGLSALFEARRLFTVAFLAESLQQFHAENALTPTSDADGQPPWPGIIVSTRSQSVFEVDRH
jgi:membrane protein YqaA with SNARE-associated domain